ncbi:MAG: hypothetical protein NZ901_13130, partial [Geminocystis sp.]|nr:hypothetical protein [Geminocystis sp.]
MVSTLKAKKGGKNILDYPLWAKEGNKPCYQYQMRVILVGVLGCPMGPWYNQSWLKESDGGFKKALAHLVNNK